MSWHARLVVECDGHVIGIPGTDTNYTHNCNAMISAVVEVMGYQLERHWLIGHMGKSWFRVLEGRSGQDGARWLREIVAALEAAPARFEAMNPSNGWGSFATLLPVLQQMQQQGEEYPSARWDVWG